MFSERSEAAREPNPLSRAVTARRATDGSIRDLTVTNPTAIGAPDPSGAIADALARAIAFPYEADPMGLRSARERVAPTGTSPDHVLLTSCTSEAYAHVFRLLCDPGDEVLVPQPSYPLLEHIAAATDVHLSPYPLTYEEGWAADANALFDAISPRTKAIVLVHPNNPTGHYLRPAEIEAMSALDLPLIVDEVFFEYPLVHPTHALRAAQVTDALVFSLDGLSKRAALPQAKLAWLSVTGPSDLVTEAVGRLELMADTFLSPSPVIMHAIDTVLDATAPVHRWILDRASARLARLRARVANTPLTLPPVEGGWVAPLRLPATRTDEAWALALLDRGVLAQPGYFYDFEPEQAWLVVSLIGDEDPAGPAFDTLLELVRE